ncbi:MAG: class I SAM-dependent methyltransferase [Candidatus Omnitrophica bacterium]|nr:class I SAM-dependent methyltransferase [Candidatus Omnitrophota bacterium]
METPIKSGDRLKRTLRKVRRAILQDEPTYYDMFQNPGEKYFARLYLHQIQKILQTGWPVQTDLPGPLKILDAGCQAGRLAIPLAQAGHQVTGVDTSGVGLNRAKRHAKESGIALRLIRANLGEWLPGQPAESFDAVICTEVLYLRQNQRELLEELLRVLRPGGLCFISHRPRGYYLAEAFQHRDWNAVRILTSAKEGTLFGSYYNWQDREELEDLYRALKVKLIAITPIGLLSWLAVKPDDLDEEGQDLLFKVETRFNKDHPGLGRYLLVSGRKEA